MQVDRYSPPPDHPLHNYVASIWRVESRAAYTRETILPKQNVDILFNLNTALMMTRGTQYHHTKLSDFHVAGPQTSAFTVLPQEDTKLVGISLKMEGCSAIFPLPLTELINQTVEGYYIFPGQRFLWEQVAEASSFAAQCTLLMSWLQQMIQPVPHIQLVQHACRLLREQPSSYTLDHLSAQLHISSRHLRRIMLRHVGVGPGEYMRLSRFVKAIYMMPQSASLTDLAYHVHYADQAHFCRDFKEIAGMTPNEYRQQMSFVPGHIFAK